MVNWIRHKWLAVFTALFGATLASVYAAGLHEAIEVFWGGSVLLFIGVALSAGYFPKKISADPTTGFVLDFETQHIPQINIQQKELDEEEIRENEEFVSSISLPNENAPQFTPFDPAVAKALKINPAGFAHLPMYLLDSAYRILDWNEAFSLVFDRTMEGRVGQSILKWTMHLDNFREVTQEGMRAFGNPEDLPRLHKERIEYKSLRYGPIVGTKRAYAIPDDDGNIIAWLISIEPHFASSATREQYQLEIVRLLENNLMWSEYALLYDKLLPRTEIYQDLLRYMTGERGPLRIPAAGSKLLDLGAGTGNLAVHLMEISQEYKILAIENNGMMMDRLEDKCELYSAKDPNIAGIYSLKQDITALTGIQDDSYDYVFMNNVLYAVADYKKCLKEALRVLRPGGEIRISGPHTESDAPVLFDYIRKDLQESGDFSRLRSIFERVKWINEFQLLPMAHKFTCDSLERDLLQIGFSTILESNRDIYKGQSLFIAAEK